MADRPSTYPELGALMAHWRNSVNLSQREASRIARKHRRNAFGYSNVSRMEAGQFQSPNKELAETISIVYGVPYDEVVREFIRCMFDVAHVSLAPSEAGQHGGIAEGREFVARHYRLVNGLRKLAIFSQALLADASPTETDLDAGATSSEKPRLRAKSHANGRRSS